MFKKNLLSSMVLVASLAFAGAVHAVAITPTVSFDPGTTLNTTGLSTFTTSGAQMVGMKVTAYFDNSSNDIAFWNTTTAPAGAASGTGWSVGFAGSTTFAPFWEVLNSGSALMTRLVIDGQPGSTIFDTILNTETTPGSALGTPFSAVDGPANLSVSATYRNQVALNNVVYGDLFTVLDIGFSAATSTAPKGFSGRLIFTADTDNTSITGDLTPVPEPASLALLGIGLAGLGFMRRRRT